MIKKSFYFKSGKHKLFGILEKPEKTKKPLIILLHGLTNSLNDCPLINETSKALHKKGFPTFRFDFYGSGRSDGQFSDKTLKKLDQNTKDGLKFAKTSLGFKKIGLWGRSLGAMLASSICDYKNIFASVIISGTTNSKISFAKLFPKKNSPSLILKGTGRIKGKPILSYNFYKQTSWLDSLQKKHLKRAENVLVLQGTKDKIIYNLNWTKDIYKTIKGNKKLEFIKNADHSFKGFEKEVVKKIVSWFEKNA
jgi:uncharacterized protein